LKAGNLTRSKKLWRETFRLEGLYTKCPERRRSAKSGSVSWKITKKMVNEKTSIAVTQLRRTAQTRQCNGEKNLLVRL